MLFNAAARADEPKITTITPEKPVRQWVVQETTGRIFASMPTADAVVEYDPATGKELRRLAIKGNPAQMVLKGHWLVAACAKDPTLALIDLKENKLAGTIPLPGQGGMYDLFCSKADNPYVFVACDPNPPGNRLGYAPAGAVLPRFLVRVNLKRREAIRLVDNPMAGLPWNQQNLLPIVMSQDGQRMLHCWYNGGVTYLHGLFDVDEEAGTFQQVQVGISGPPGMNGVRGYGAVVASRRWWTVGNCLFPTELGPSLRAFAGSPVAIHPVLDLAASLQESQLVLQTFSAAETLKEIELPDAPSAEGAPAAGAAGPAPAVMPAAPAAGPFAAPAVAFGPGGAPAGAVTETVQYDLAGQRVFCGLATKGYVVGLTGLGVKIPNRLEIVVPSQTTATAGKTTRVPLATNLPPGDRQPTFTLDSPPPFAKIEGTDLVLAPTLAQLGTHEVVVKASQGDLSDQVTLSIHVEVPSVHLGFSIHGVAVDRQQRSAVAWGPSPAGSGAAAMPPADPRMDFAVIDVASQKVIGAHSLPGGIQFIALDEKYVFVIPPNPHVLYRLDRADPSRSRRMLLGGAPQALAIAPDKCVAVEIHDGTAFLLRVLDRETLQPIDRDEGEAASGDGGNRGRSFSPFNRSGRLPIAEPLGDGAVQRLERILEADTGDVRCLLAGANLPDLVEIAARTPFFPANFRPGGADAGGHLWGRAIVNNQLTMALGKAVATLPVGAEISPDYPLAAGLRSTWTGNSQETVLEFFSLVLGEAVGSIDLSGNGTRSDGSRPRVAYRSSRRGGTYYLPAPATPVGYGGGQAGLTFVKDTVLLPQGNRLLFCQIPAEVRKDLPLPLALKYPRIGIASVDKPLVVEFAAVGGQGGRTFTLAKKFEGLLLDAASGKATIDLPAIWKKSLPVLKQANPRLALERQVEAMRSEFRRLTGRPLAAEKFAFAVPLEVVVSDEEGQQDRLNLSVIVLAPAEELGKPPAGPLPPAAGIGFVPSSTPSGMVPTSPPNGPGAPSLAPPPETPSAASPLQPTPTGRAVPTPSEPPRKYK
jgi:hypothetical protein